MCKMKVKNFGPIKQGLTEHDGFIDFNKVTIFIGDQGTGKSTLAKLFSSFSWIEKAIQRGDYDKKQIESKGFFRKNVLAYHRMENYLNIQNSEIIYEGEGCQIHLKDEYLFIEKNNSKSYSIPQIMYIPAERNFISYIRNPEEIKLASDSLKDFLVEFDNAKRQLKDQFNLPINDVSVEYDRLNDIINIKKSNDEDSYKLRLTDASSGFQSSVPALLVSSYLANKIANNKGSFDFSDPLSTKRTMKLRAEIAPILEKYGDNPELIRSLLSTLFSEYANKSLLNIVEEPEQNLFPLSQWKVLSRLLSYNNYQDDNKLVITTHSPYIVNFMGISAQAHQLYEKIKERKNETLLSDLEKILPSDAMVSNKNISIYQMKEDGSLTQLTSEYGIPSSRNQLNDYLHEGNKRFDQLLDIEDRLSDAGVIHRD